MGLATRYAGRRACVVCSVFCDWPPFLSSFFISDSKLFVLYRKALKYARDPDVAIFPDLRVSKLCQWPISFKKPYITISNMSQDSTYLTTHKSHSHIASYSTQFLFNFANHGVCILHQVSCLGLGPGRVSVNELYLRSQVET